MKRCPKCAEKIQDAALVCRYCGSEQTKPSPKIPPIRLVLIGGAILLFVVWPGGRSDGDNSPAHSEPTRASSAPSKINVQILALRKIEDRMRDPRSMTTRYLRVPEGAGYLCGEVNGKNAMGGMTGYKRFIAGAGSEMPTAIDGEGMDGAEFEKAWAKLCIR